MPAEEDGRPLRSYLAPWSAAELPRPPRARGLGVLGAAGPGAIILGIAIGSGEWLLGPAAFVKYGLSLLWVSAVAMFLQTLFNTEVVRYTAYTGEPIFTGFMRTAPGPRFWGTVYAALSFLQLGWPGWAGAAAGAVFYLFSGRMATPSDAGLLSWIAVGLFLVSVMVLMVGPRIERTLEILSWMLVLLILGGLLMLCLLLAPLRNWLATALGFVGYDVSVGKFSYLPPGGDWFLIGAFAAYSGAGGIINLALSSWARDKGFGMGQVAGYIPAAVSAMGRGSPQTEDGRSRLPLGPAPVGSVFPLTPQSLSRWRGWWRIIQMDQWGVFLVGALLGMGLPALLYTTLLAPGRDMGGLAAAAALAEAIAGRRAVALASLTALIGTWILFSTQLGIMESLVRVSTDLLWAGSRRVRRWRGGDVRLVYYSALGAVVVWGLIAMRLTEPFILLQLGANVAGMVFVLAGLHVLRLNTTLLPPELRPPLWRRVGLVLLSLFYGVFVYLWLMGGFLPDPGRGFLFNVARHLGL